MQNLETGHTRKDLITNYLLPALAPALVDKSELLAKTESVCQLHKVIKGQILEHPGPEETGMLWLSVSAIVHGYFYDESSKTSCGTRIWKKRELIFDGASLVDREYRSDFLEVLEPGEVLSLPYTDLRRLMRDVPEVAEQISWCKSQAEQHYRRRGLLLVKPSLQRVREFESDQSLFAKVASNSIKALHVGLTRQSYELQLKLLKKLRENDA